MAISIRKLLSGLTTFHEFLFDADFVKTYVVGVPSERALSIPLRFFLGGLNKETWPEHRHDELTDKGVKLGSIGRPHQVDFWVDGVSLEVATKSGSETIQKLRPQSNKDELRKLSTQSYRSVLALFDLEKYKNSDHVNELTELYRSSQGLLSGGNPVTVAYFCRVHGRTERTTLRISRRRK